MPLCQIILLGIQVLIGIGITMIGSLQTHFAHTHCYGARQPWMVAVGLSIAFTGVGGIFFRLKTYPRFYLLHIVFNVFLFFALLAILIVFWRAVVPSHRGAERLWYRELVLSHKWDRILDCYRSHDYCGRGGHKKECCEMPPGCDQLNGTLPTDCLHWRDVDYTLCYRCETCRRATFFERHAYGRRMNPALITFLIIFAMVIGLLIYVESCTGGGYIGLAVFTIPYWLEGPDGGQLELPSL